MDELYHHGIKGQKWGVRRFQNPDVVKSNGGKNRYNTDAWDVATSAGLKFRNLAELNAKKRAAEKVLYKDPKAFGQSKERQEYIEAMVRTQRSFAYHQKLTEKLLEKYDDISFDFLTEEGTNEKYVQAILKSKAGETKVAEIYLGYRITD